MNILIIFLLLVLIYVLSVLVMYYRYRDNRPELRLVAVLTAVYPLLWVSSFFAAGVLLLGDFSKIMYKKCTIFLQKVLSKKEK